MTETELNELGKRAVACENWLWAAGMKLLDEHDGPIYRLTYIPGEYTVEDPEAAPVAVLAGGGGDCAPLWGWPAEGSGWTPDLSDPATVGCLLHLVREAHDNTEIYAHPVIDEEDPTRWEAGHPLRWGRRRLAVADTEAEALVAALENAPQ